MNTENEELLKELKATAEKDVLLDKLLRLEREVGIIDGRRREKESIVQTGITIATIVLAALTLFSWAYISTRIDSEVDRRVMEHVDESVKEFVEERMAQEDFQDLLTAEIDNVSKEVIDEAKEAVVNAQIAVSDAEKAATDAEIAVVKADRAADKAEDASTVAEEASDKVETIANQTSEEEP